MCKNLLDHWQQISQQLLEVEVIALLMTSSKSLLRWPSPDKKAWHFSTTSYSSCHAAKCRNKGSNWKTRSSFWSKAQSRRNTSRDPDSSIGWDLDTRSLICSLPEDKYVAWCKVISDILSSDTKPVSKALLESVIGRLTHASWVVPLSRHFLSKLKASHCKGMCAWTERAPITYHFGAIIFYTYGKVEELSLTKKKHFLGSSTLLT